MSKRYLRIRLESGLVINVDNRLIKFCKMEGYIKVPNSTYRYVAEQMSNEEIKIVISGSLKSDIRNKIISEQIYGLNSNNNTTEKLVSGKVNVEVWGNGDIVITGKVM